MNQVIPVVDLKDELSAYDAISVFWGIPRHRVKALIVSGAYGLGGAYKTPDEWQTQLAIWDQEYGEPLRSEVVKGVVPVAGTRTGRFVSTAKELLSFRGKKK